MKKDIEHLNLLAIFHYVMAGLTALTALLPLIYVAIGVMILVSAPNAPKGGGPPPAIIGWIFVIVFGGLSLLMVAMAVVCGMAGYGLHKHKWRMFCFINAAILLTQMPHGTILGIFTILVLCRPTVEDLFAGRIYRHDPEDDVYDPLPPPGYDDFRDRPLGLPGDEGYYQPRGGNP